ncbi:hypothetical protein ABIC83_002555 [Roseateles asaccharophilus]|uniref:hypothetical protein n=1 Tax=Roseateles asaccharophilus TaxID=582607 RepID=UPI0038323BF5
MKMPSLGTVVFVAVLAAATYAGVVVAKEIRDRRALIASLETYGAAHPEDAELVKILVGCNEKFALRVDTTACSAQLFEKFGPQVMERMAYLAQEGAFTPAH